MKTARLKQARRLFFHDLVPTHIARHNARHSGNRVLHKLGETVEVPEELV